MVARPIPIHPADITWLTDDVATGGDFDYHPKVAAAQLDDLISQGVALVIDTRIEADDAEIWDRISGVKYVHLPQDDFQGYHIDATHFDAAVELARAAKAEGGKVFVHCHMGINRGPSTAFAILLDQGMEPTEAFDLIRAKRPIAAVYYAEDALRADLARRDTGWNTSAEKLTEFAAHRDQVFGQLEMAQIQHIIRDTHLKRGDWFW